MKHKTLVHSGIELLMMISEGFKVSDFGGGPDHKSSNFYPSSMYQRLEIFCMQTCPGILYKLHMVSLASILMMCCAFKNLPKTQRLLLVFWQKVKVLGHESPSPVEHKNALGSGIELLMMISEGFKVSDFGGGPGHESCACTCMYYRRSSSICAGTGTLPRGIA